MAGTDRQKKLMTGGPAIILVEPQLGENIGMVARAMANFGLSDLRLVNPRDGWPNDKARSAASKADHVIDATQVFDTLAEAIADLNFVVATTARERDGFKPVCGPVEATGKLRRVEEGDGRAGILFGRERWGLKNHEITLADEIVTFPVNPAFASLNIAQAVLLMAYEWMKSGMESDLPADFRQAEMEPATKADMQGLFDHLEEALEARGYFRPASKKPKMVENLRAVLSRQGFFLPEINLLRGVIRSLDRFSRKKPKGSGAPDMDPSDEAVHSGE
ncbi:RNA methyltransferase [Hoeflea sp. WL0058]|uniref:tRNA (cytidine/uridine-2'-O-)-methyltransferase TrmJ n=1 Tax=Flavimaribacter sediminis TaxID=2865987 RepID=A0AAE3CYM8_9HYPH|nr:RNA methyltransferase [Flavimaribacter sediminis]MBW8636470.1 RNA methyltransferase [Flavimaribacter sediminis]